MAEHARDAIETEQAKIPSSPGGAASEKLLAEANIGQSDSDSPQVRRLELVHTYATTLKAAFEHVDADLSGYLSPLELSNAASSMKQNEPLVSDSASYMHKLLASLDLPWNSLSAERLGELALVSSPLTSARNEFIKTESPDMAPFAGALGAVVGAFGGTLAFYGAKNFLPKLGASAAILGAAMYGLGKFLDHQGQKLEGENYDVLRNKLMSDASLDKDLSISRLRNAQALTLSKW